MPGLTMKIFRPALLLVSLAASYAFAEVTLETPRGGWRYSEGEAAGFRQQVNYPAPKE